MSTSPNQPERFPNGPFLRYMVGEGISMTGTWMQGMALGWVMTEAVARERPSASASAFTVGNRTMNRSKYGMTVATCVCCSMISDTQTR